MTLRESTMNRKLVSIFILCAGVSAIAIASTDASAKWRRFNGVSCSNDGTLWRNLVGLNNYGNQTVTAHCDVGDDSDFAKTEINTLNVHVYDGHNGASVAARVCTTTWNGWFGSCGSWSSSGSAFIGNATLRPSRSQLSSAADFSMLEVQVPPGSALKGYYTADHD